MKDLQLTRWSQHWGYVLQGRLTTTDASGEPETVSANDLFYRPTEHNVKVACFSAIQQRIAVCLDEARASGDIPADSDPERMASLLVDCWEGAALRSRLRGTAAPLGAMLDFYVRSVVGG